MFPFYSTELHMYTYPFNFSKFVILQPQYSANNTWYGIRSMNWTNVNFCIIVKATHEFQNIFSMHLYSFTLVLNLNATQQRVEVAAIRRWDKEAA